jgi:hypothetical protein
VEEVPVEAKPLAGLSAVPVAVPNPPEPLVHVCQPAGVAPGGVVSNDSWTPVSRVMTAKSSVFTAPA